MNCLKVETARSRRGVTLIELLIVITIIVLIAGLTLPSMRSLLKDQRITQTARTVQGFIDSAKARAVAQGRPVAIILERAGATNTVTCPRLSIGEVFPPYEGDWAGTLGTLEDTGTDGYFDRILIPAAQASLAYPTAGVISIGDEITIGNNPYRFRINAAPTIVNTDVAISFANPPTKADVNGIHHFAMEGMLPASGGAHYPYGTGRTAPAVPFKVFRRPSKTMTGSLVLPRGVCVDLTWSGLGGTLAQFNTGNASSIFIVFEPNGTVSSIYEYPTGSSWPALSTIHLLVGRSDQVGAPAAVSDRDDTKPNLLDTANRWVSINTRNGNVYTSNVAANAPPGDIAVARTFAILANSGTN